MSKQEDKYQLLKKKGMFDKLNISNQVLSHLGKAWFIFIIAFLPQTFIGTYNSTGSIDYSLLNMSIISFAIGFAFLFHELGHKFAAQYFKARAEFKLDARGLLITVISIAMGFYFLMPGATFWQSNLSQYSDVRGRVSGAGPIVNRHLACLSLGLFIFENGAATHGIGSIEYVLYTFGYISFILNVYLGLFNLIPVWILDGKKIFEWSEIIWFCFVMMFIILIIAIKVAFPHHPAFFNFYFFSV